MDKDNNKIQEVFQKLIKIEPKVMGIETMFNNTRRLEKTNFAPPYQRNYVWDNEKATFFLESIILGTEIPPLVFFKTENKIEVIDGRQRYETIYNFVKNNSKQKLSIKGLWIFKDLKNKKFIDLSREVKDTFWDTKLRIIEFSFINETENKNYEEVIKREIFKRYNSGITPLRSTEIDKAKYLDNDLNSYFKTKITKDKLVNDLFRKIFHYEKDDIEILLREIRKILVLDSIPIKYYSTKKDIVINKFYEFFYGENEEDVEEVYFNFMRKLQYLDRIYIKLQEIDTNRLIFECLFWGISIVEKEIEDVSLVHNILFEKENYIVENIKENLAVFTIERNSFTPQIMGRYQTIASLFNNIFKIDFKNYLNNHQDFKDDNKKIDNLDITDSSLLSKFESLRLNKPDASSITIDDICRQMSRNRFLIRPSYQRKEVINTSKSSAIIESIILGIKLPPIFIYKRKDGISEVIDGQQRLLSIIGFIGENYVNEDYKLQKSKKHEYSLNLKNGILREYDRKKFKTLPDKIQNKILDYDLWIIEINEKNNKDFAPIDLYLRLNTKPFPIKENTFEMWNSYIDREIIDSIRNLQRKYRNWFFLRKNNKRMNNENLFTSLIYLSFKNKENRGNLKKIYNTLDIYKTGERIGVRIKAKNDITNLLESINEKHQILKFIGEFEKSFINVLIQILDENKPKKLTNKLDILVDAESRRTAKNFYVLWLLIDNVNPYVLNSMKSEAREEIKQIIKATNEIDSKKAFEKKIKSFWQKYQA